MTTGSLSKSTEATILSLLVLLLDELKVRRERNNGVVHFHCILLYLVYQSNKVLKEISNIKKGQWTNHPFQHITWKMKWNSWGLCYQSWGVEDRESEDRVERELRDGVGAVRRRQWRLGFERHAEWNAGVAASGSGSPRPSGSVESRKHNPKKKQT